MFYPERIIFILLTLTEAVTDVIPVQKSRSSEIALNITLSLQSEQVPGDKAEKE